MKKAMICAFAPIVRAVLGGPGAGRAEGEQGLTRYWFDRATKSCTAITIADWRSSNHAILRAEGC
jgi:hypothetical protein